MSTHASPPPVEALTPCRFVVDLVGVTFIVGANPRDGAPPQHDLGWARSLNGQ
jgi:hypothetical protein